MKKHVNGIKNYKPYGPFLDRYSLKFLFSLVMFIFLAEKMSIVKNFTKDPNHVMTKIIVCIQIIIIEISTEININEGCPQGKVISPLFWNLVVDELIRENLTTKESA